MRLQSRCRLSGSRIHTVDHVRTTSVLIQDLCSFGEGLDMYANAGKTIETGQQCMEHSEFDVTTGKNSMAWCEKTEVETRWSAEGISHKQLPWKLSQTTVKKAECKMYDYLIVGAGLYGAVFARQMTDAGKRVLVIDKRSHIGGNVYTETIEGIHVHKYGAHIFHTNNKQVWDYVNRFAQFNHFINSPIAKYHGEVYSLPFNMYTFNRMWGVTTPEEARSKILAQQLEAGIRDPKNLEEQAISLVGTDVYQKLIKGYTEKQWGRDCRDLPPFIIKRLPVRLTYDNNYFNAAYQGIPVGGYTRMVRNMLEGIEVRLDTDYLHDRAGWNAAAKRVVFTGAIDAYFDCSLGALEYRSVRFETQVLDMPNFQGNAAVNYTDRETPWTRIIEHKWFEFGLDEHGQELPKTVISREFSSEWKPGDEPYYPVNDEKNSRLYEQYRQLALQETRVLFGGRLGEYKYYDMDAVIDAAMKSTAAQNGQAV